MGGQVERAKRTDLSPSFNAGIRQDTNHRAGNAVDHLVARHDVFAITITQLIAINLNSINFHNWFFRLIHHNFGHLNL